MKEPTSISLEEKWAQIDAITEQLRVLDTEWDKLMKAQRRLLKMRLQKPRVSRSFHGSRVIARRTFAQAEQLARDIREGMAKGLTQRAVADQLGITRGLVAQYLSPKCKAMWRITK